MKNIIYFLLLCCLSGCFGKKPTLDTGHEGKPMPALDLLLLDSSTHINMETLSLGKPIVMIYFSPRCPYCKKLTNDITDNIKKLQGIQFYFVSEYPLTEVKNYEALYRLHNYTNITVGLDVHQYFNNYFEAPGVPCIAIYGKDKLLKRVLMGTISPNLIKDLASE